MIWEKSKCRIKMGWLHKFEIFSQDDRGVLEICVRCGLRKVFEVREGKINNLDYLSYHVRNALPKEHNLFLREYVQK